MICNHNISIRPSLAVGVGVGVRVGVGLPPMPEGGGGAYTLATWEEYMQFKMHMNIKIGGMLLDKPSFDEIEKEQQIL